MTTSILLTNSFYISQTPKLPKPNYQTPQLKPINIFPKQTFLKSTNFMHTKCLIKSRKVHKVCVLQDSDTGVSEDVLVGEDSAKFELAKQKISSWVYFGGVLGVVLFILDVVWLDNTTGFGKVFIESVESVSDSPEVYFINHRYDGVQLWQLQSEPLLHHLLWITNFISFFFLYPSTFNLLEVAAVDKPKMHLWESGIMRITRHPQLVGQVMWCLAHTIWIGNSVAVAASVGLIGLHLFGAWNGDRRLRIRYGEAFDIVKSRTSVLPFAAILDGRQKLPKDYYKEFIRLPYLVITGLTVGAYLAHPLMQAASLRLHW